MAPTLESLVSDVYGDNTEKLITVENPYYQAKAIPDSLTGTIQETIAATAAKDPDRYGLGEIAGATAITGLLSAILGSKGASYQDTLRERFEKAVAGEEDVGYLPSGLFGAAKRKNALFGLLKQARDYERKRENEQAQRDFKNKAYLSLLEKAGTSDFPEQRDFFLKKAKEFKPMSDDEKVASMLTEMAKVLEMAKAKNSPTSGTEPIKTLTPDEKIGLKPLKTEGSGGFGGGAASGVLGEIDIDDANRMYDGRSKIDLQKQFGYKGAVDYIKKVYEREAKERLAKEKWWNEVDKPTQQKLGASIGTLRSLRNIAQGIDMYADEFDEMDLKPWAKTGLSLGAWQTTKDIGGFKANELKSLMMTWVPRVVKLMGDVGNLAEQEQQRVIDATLGNFTSSPRVIAKRINNLVFSVKNAIETELATRKAGVQEGGDYLLNAIRAFGTKGESDFPDLYTQRKIADDLIAKITADDPASDVSKTSSALEALPAPTPSMPSWATQTVQDKNGITYYTNEDFTKYEEKK